MSRLALEHNPGTGLVTRVGRKGFGHLSLLEFVVQGKRFLRKDRSCKFEHDNHDNLFIMNNVSFIFSTSKHNTECFSISFRARKNHYDHLSRGQCLFERIESNIFYWS